MRLLPEVHETRDPNIVSLENQLAEHLCQPVAVDWVPLAGTTLTIKVASEEELHGFLEKARPQAN
jgi:hypothetical protein